MKEIKLYVTEVPPVRCPVTVGVPFSRQDRVDIGRVQVFCSTHGGLPTQTKVLANWNSGQPKWVAVTFICPPASAPSLVLRVPATSEGATPPVKGLADHDLLQVVPRGRHPALLFRDTRGREIARVFPNFHQHAFAQSHWRLVDCHLADRGPLFDRHVLAGRITRTPLRFTCVATHFSSLSLVRFAVTLKNPARARHRRGYWELGDPASFSFLRWGFALDFDGSTDATLDWQIDEGTDPRTSRRNFEIRQSGSGGQNWPTRVHLDRHGRLPHGARGYIGTADGDAFSGERAAPIVALATGTATLACAVENFWQRFPTRIAWCGANRLEVDLLPYDSDPHELQPGEHLTKVWWLAYGAATSCHSLSFVRSPPSARCDPAWTASTKALAFFPEDTEDRPEAESIKRTAMHGPRSLFAKREVADEFGWRHFGDMWADHEQEHYRGQGNVVSHYNNQYDLLHSILIQFLRSGTRQWWSLADDLARHILDIDIYHTRNDKAAYSGGLFWHTAHYQDAGLATHRCFAKSQKAGVCPSFGGGPGAEHNYTSGLALYYWLTGEPRARLAVQSLADWVLAMDDGAKHALGVVCRAPTGYASKTATADYHGPGRGAGNSINALLDAWQVTNDAMYLAGCEALICRTIHPRIDIDSLELHNAELRWSYTVYLQALAKYLQLMEQMDKLGDVYWHARASLVRFGQWMVANERWYLDHAEQLEFPTTTWVAQELRKASVILQAGRYVQPHERSRFLERAAGIFHRAWSELSACPERGQTRLVALVMQQCYIETYGCREDGVPLAPPTSTSPPTELASPIPFRTQKELIARRLRQPLSWWRWLASPLHPLPWYNLLRTSWAAERVRLSVARLR